ncbi:5-oxoprolinase [Leucosporidium creatinivorum]|uniref:5-oxoprolinase n=1 Tax=Leucosporidium creatinivorum TaxID=106004 RepID=A0A1Y2EM60_9BASI|nr:5-oxoprolinase [Leucosporidium creatinivorum]
MPSKIADHSIKISVDRGGSFTDVHASWPAGSDGEQGEGGAELKEVIVKLLSVHDHYPDAPREGVRRVLEIATGEEFPRDSQLPVDKIASIRLSTTVATNALLERQGAKHALLITKGFGDLLQIGNQSRPKIFELDIKRPSVLYSDVVEVDERVTLMGYTSDPKRAERAVVFTEDGKVEKHYDDEELPEGEVVRGMSGEAVRIIKKVDEEAVRKDLQKLYDDGYRSLAIVLIHAFTFPDHERQIASIAESIGFKYISASSSSLPMIRMVARGTSTTVDAYLTPVLQKYLDGFFAGFDPSLRETNTAEAPQATTAEEAKKTTSVEFMRSDGGLTDVRGFSGLKSILSGPAGGVVGFAQTSWEEGGQAVIGLDMGGTSTDVSRFDGTHETVFETTTAGVTVQSPQLNINTVASGGGSCLKFRNGLFVVGPDSVGSNPGPACYRKGGQPAITDANLVLGRLVTAYFPKIFGEKEDEGLDEEASLKALEKLREQVNEETGKNLSTDEVAWGFIKVANESMCRPIRSLTEARGYDASKHILAAFGGAGGQHACAIASTLGIKTILVHRYSSILSAYGMALAERVFERQEPSSETWSDSSAPRLKERLSALGKEVHSELERQGFTTDHIEIHPYLNCRYNGTDSALMIHEPEEGESFDQAFAKAYKQEFSFSMPNVDIIVDDVRVRGVGKSFDSLGDSVFTEAKKLDFKAVDREPSSEGKDQKQKSKCAEKASVYFEEKGRVEVPVFLLERLEAGDLIEGPAMVLDGTQTLVIDPEAKAKITSKHVMIELS